MVDLPGKLNPKLDKLRALKAGKLNAEPFTIAVRVRQFADIFSDGYSSETITPLLCDGAAAPVKVLSQRDVALSHSLYQEQDLKVTVTPSFSGGGYDLSTFDPVQTTNTTDLVFIVHGPGLPPEGAVYKKVGLEVGAFAVKVIIRNTGQKP